VTPFAHASHPFPLSSLGFHTPPSCSPLGRPVTIRAGGGCFSSLPRPQICLLPRPNYIFAHAFTSFPPSRSLTLHTTFLPAFPSRSPPPPPLTLLSSLGRTVTIRAARGCFSSLPRPQICLLPRPNYIFAHAFTSSRSLTLHTTFLPFCFSRSHPIQNAFHYSSPFFPSPFFP
jgi:hypothetical protein